MSFGLSCSIYWPLHVVLTRLTRHNIRSKLKFSRINLRQRNGDESQRVYIQLKDLGRTGEKLLLYGDW